MGPMWYWLYQKVAPARICGPDGKTPVLPAGIKRCLMPAEKPWEVHDKVMSCQLLRPPTFIGGEDDGAIWSNFQHAGKAAGVEPPHAALSPSAQEAILGRWGQDANSGVCWV